MEHQLPKSPSLPWTEAEFCIIDIETTGLDPRRDELISFASVPVIRGRIRPAAGTHFHIRPRRTISPESIKVHTLRNSDLRDMPPIRARRGEIVNALRGKVVVAHSAWFEASFLGRALRGTNSHLSTPMIDTARLTPLCIDCPATGNADIALEFAAEKAGLPVHSPHTALGDAMTTAQLFVYLAHQLSRERTMSVADLIALSNRETNLPGV